MSDDDAGEDFINRYQLHLMRAAARKAAEEQSRVDAAEIERKAKAYAEALRQELVARRSVSVPLPAPTPAPEPVPQPAPVPEPQPVSTPDLDSMSMEEYAAYRNSGQPASKRLGTGRYWVDGGLERDSKPE
jgi:hypothetical protein